MLTRDLLCFLGNPLHSTAMEEDLNVSQEGQTNKGETLKTAVKQRGAAVKRKEMERDEENEKKRGRRSTEEQVKAR